MASLDPIPQIIALRRAGTSAVSLQLPEGPAGPAGSQGIQGPAGPQGIQGPAGESFINLDGGTPTTVFGGIDPIDGGDI